MLGTFPALEKPLMLGSILIVDDSAFTRRALIRDLPEGLVAQVVEAGDGLEALEAFGRVEPRLLFLDVVMPRMGGIEVLEALQGRQHNTCVVVVTSERDPDIEGRAKALGAHTVLHKPWDRADITRVVGEAGLVR